MSQGIAITLANEATGSCTVDLLPLGGRLGRIAPVDVYGYTWVTDRTGAVRFESAHEAAVALRDLAQELKFPGGRPMR